MDLNLVDTIKTIAAGRGEQGNVPAFNFFFRVKEIAL